MDDDKKSVENSAILISEEERLSNVKNQQNKNILDKEDEKDQSMSRFEEMFKAGVHFAYSRTKRHPKMGQYIYGVKNNTEIFDLEKTDELLENAVKFLRQMAEEKKLLLFAGAKPGVAQIIQKAAIEIAMPYVATRWLGGTLTNFKVIRNKVLDFEKLRNDMETGELEKYTKKERIKINKDFSGMEKNFSGLENLVSLPDALLLVDPEEENTALREAKRLKIPIIAILNNDCDPTSITYPIPANDAAPKSVKYIINRLIKGYLEK